MEEQRWFSERARALHSAIRENDTEKFRVVLNDLRNEPTETAARVVTVRSGRGSVVRSG